MLFISAEDVSRLATPHDMVEALREGFRSDITAPVRHHHNIEKSSDKQDSILLLMPAWHSMSDEKTMVTRPYAGVKVVTVSPENANLGKSTITGSYLLNDGASGETLAVIDGLSISTARTAAASALAADYLARRNVKNLLLIGAGAMAEPLIAAHSAVRDYESVTIWNHNPEKAHALAERLNQAMQFDVTATNDLKSAAQMADVISCATRSTEPLIAGEWVAPGTHVDLVGAFTPVMRESDAALVAKADVYVDTRDGAMAEAGDLLLAQAEDAFSSGDIQADLFQLTRSEARGRQSDDAITLFKSVGAALEDLAGAVMLYERAI